MSLEGMNSLHLTRVCYFSTLLINYKYAHILLLKLYWIAYYLLAPPAPPAPPFLFRFCIVFTCIFINVFVENICPIFYII
ncbi:hypothetical protein C1646_707775 [Rhizophagus diaphanus]|nr:hypothetical protein C1646_707775 [Rhizophagus diaphanus] [Rhizophagus sp. MUCL 43196]